MMRICKNRKIFGFTLVELLAIIIVLAILLLIGIPIILNMISGANKTTFIQYYERMAKESDKKFESDIALKKIDMDSCIIYDITTDFGISSTGKFKGYVLLTSDDKKYITLYNDEYMIVAKEYVNKFNPNDLEKYKDDQATREKLTKEYLCNASENCTTCNYFKEDKTVDEIVKPQSISKLVSGTSFNSIIKTLANGISTGTYDEDYKIKKIKFIPNSDDEYGIDVSTEDSTVKTYASYENGIIYLKSKNDKIYLNEYCAYMFHDFMELNEIDLEYFDSSLTTSMYGMFDNLPCITKLNVSHFDTSKVTTMTAMFIALDNLEEVDVSNFDMSNVKTAFAMFFRDGNLKELDVSSWDVSNLEDFTQMFLGCSSIKTLDVSNWDTRSAKKMGGLFEEMNNLEYLDVSHFNTSKVTDFSYMFAECEKLKSLDVSHFDTRNATNMTGMFEYLRSIESIDVSNFVTDNVTDMHGMFRLCQSLKSLDVSNFNTSKVTNMYEMFKWIENVEYLDLSNFDTSNVTNMGEMFYDDTKLKHLDIHSFDTSKVKDMSYMFAYVKFDKLDISNFDTSSLEDTHAMFYDMYNLTEIIIGPKWTTKNVTDFHMMFEGVPKLRFDFSKNINTSSATCMERMFGKNDMEILDLRGFDTSKVFDMNLMFWGVDAKELRLDTFDFSAVQYHGGNPYYNSSINGPMFSHISDSMVIYVKDEAAKKFVEDRLVEAEKTNTVIIAS
ncbi:MAG: BspA family leucine-rich repeat surface protein [Bacilli bacterium]|nr:BspA family leucine-rich repeat surface protein [Bacilli bacterium]